MPATKTTPAETAAEVVAYAREHGVSLHVSGGVLRAEVTFEAGDRRAYMQAEARCSRALSFVRQTSPGTVWGTDSGSIGGHVGLTEGRCHLSKSGCAKRVVAEIAKQI